MPIAKVHRISAAAPDDVSGIEAAIAAGRIDPAGIRAIFGKTEGNGCVNDFSRGFAVQSLQLMLQRHGGTGAGASLVMSGGTEGGMAPHWLVLERGEGDAGTGPALAIGSAHTGDVLPEQIGRLSQVDMVAAGVRSAMREAQIASPADVHFVQVKCPLLTAGPRRRGAGARRRDRHPRHPEIDGPVACGERARHRRGAGRDRSRTQSPRRPSARTRRCGRRAPARRPASS